MPLGTPFLFPNDDTWGQPPLRCTQGRLSAVRPSEARRSLQIPRGLKSARNDNLEKRSVAARLSRALSKQFSVEAWLKPCPPDLASRSCTGETPAPTSQIEAGEGARSIHSYFPAPAPLLEGGKASGGFGPLSPIVLTLANSSLMLMPESVSKI